MQCGEGRLTRMKLKPNNGFYELFRNKKIMIIVPHQDDELFICGTILSGITRVTSSVYVVYTTNGDYENNYNIRKKQCIRALAKYRISSENIIFLGYGDQYTSRHGHIYNTPPTEIAISKAGYSETYGDEYCYLKHGLHHAYSIDNLKNDLTEAIVDFFPDVLFCNDVDWHPDHRATSFLFDTVLGEIVKQNDTYCPLVFKSFIYYLGWDGEKDYSTENLLATKKQSRINNNDKRFELNNPYYAWDKRMRFPIDIELVQKRNNTLYKALKQYRFSQNALAFFDSMMNSDAVFWQKNMRNYALHAWIEVSSGNKEFLQDNIIVDSSNIMKKKMMCFDRKVWYPACDDKRPTIKMFMKNMISANKIVLYRDVQTYACQSAEVSLSISGRKGETHFEEMTTCRLDMYDMTMEIPVDETIGIMAITITIDNCKIGFSEIEVVRDMGFRYLKILVDNNYVYTHTIERNCTKLPVKIVANECTNDEMITKIVSVPQNSMEWINNQLVFADCFQKGMVSVSLKNDRSVFDNITIQRKVYI